MVMNNKLDFMVYIGRFSPFHNGHLSVINEALSKAKQVIVCIGSANSPRTIKNPWTETERASMIISSLSSEDQKRIRIQFIEDRLYQNAEWANLVRSAVRAILMDFYPGKPEKANVGLALPEKDSTSWYVNLFPEWEKIKMGILNPLDEQPLAATKIRELLLTGNGHYISHAVPEPVYDFMKTFSKTDHFYMLKEEYVKGVDYERLYENSPKGHSINFFTADSIVIQGGHVLLVRRKNSPGKGLWALPGGHVNPNETAQEASLRELDEETNINIQKDVLNRCLVGEKLFDHPDRSMRARITKHNARTATMTFCYKLDDSKPMPRVKAGDDAEEAWWFPIETVKNSMRREIFEDHMDLINYWAARI
jgi:bifunctional NMN adenylyltransferase/nudix hydrolase